MTDSPFAYERAEHRAACDDDWLSDIRYGRNGEEWPEELRGVEE